MYANKSQYLKILNLQMVETPCHLDAFMPHWCLTLLAYAGSAVTKSYINQASPSIYGMTKPLKYK